MKGVVIVKKESMDKQDKTYIASMKVWFKERQACIEENDLRMGSLSALINNYKKQIVIINEENRLYKKQDATAKKEFTQYLKTHRK